MALSEHREIDRIEIVGPGRHIQLRTATVIGRDGIEISRTFQRRVVREGDDLDGEDPQVRAIAALVWTAAPDMDPDPEPQAP